MLVLLFLLPWRGLEAQDDAPPKLWRGTAQGNGSLFFGETQQQVLGASAALSRSDSLMEFSGSFQTLYGEASVEDGPRSVVKRLWLASLNVDWRPEARFSPFVLATFEKNLAKRIASRFNSGVGFKLTAFRSEDAEASLSIALLDERIRELGGGPGATSRLTRWSARLRARRDLNGRASLSHTTFWRPSAASVNRFIVQSSTEVSVGLTARTSMTINFLDIYDSEAVSRGSRSYNDGQLLFGVKATF